MRTPTALLLVLLAATVCRGGYKQDLADNRRIHAVPRTGAVKIDGDLTDWDRSGGILMCQNVNQLLDRNSAWIYMMYDKQALYVAVKVRDDTPMLNGFDPRFEQLICHRGDSFFLRFRDWDSPNFFTYWWSAKKRPAAVKAMGVPYHKQKKYSNPLAAGLKLAVTKWENGRGYTQEMRIPWPVIVGDGDPPQAGAEVLGLVGVYWSGKNPRDHFSYNRFDLIADGFKRPTAVYWLPGPQAWGKIVLSRKGNLDLPPPPWLQKAEQTAADTGPRGTIPVRLQVPRDAARFTVVVEDADGNRIRNLAGDFNPEAFAVAQTAETRTVQVLWDGLDDWGKLVEPGTYRVRGLTHTGLDAVYEMSFYNPGTPPWKTADGTGGWGADHSPPQHVARAGKVMIVAAHTAEGGSGIIGIGADGKRLWGEKRGATVLAADDEFVYFIMNHWGERGLCRLSARDGSFAPIKYKGKLRFPVELKEIFGEPKPAPATAMAAHDGRLALALNDDRVVLLDGSSAAVLKTVKVPHPAALAFADADTLFAISKTGIVRVDLETGALAPVKTPGVKRPTAIAVDGDGNLVVADDGPDCQVKVFGRQGKLRRRIGRRGGRPRRGPFDVDGLVNPTAVAVAADGRIWVVEHGNYPRRVSVWTQAGAFDRDYIGGTGYGGSGAYLHDQDPTLAYVGPVEMKLDRRQHSWRVSHILWAPAPGDPAANRRFQVPAGSAWSTPQRWRRRVGGAPWEYMYVHLRDGTQLVFMQRDKTWQPVAMICLVGHIAGRMRVHHHRVSSLEPPAGEFAGLDVWDGCFWNDANGDGHVQRAECEIVKGAAVRKRRQSDAPAGLAGLAVGGNGWGPKIGSDFTIACGSSRRNRKPGLTLYRPIRFTAAGAPVYGAKGMRVLPPKERGSLAVVAPENLVLCLSWKGYAGRTSGVLGLDAETGRMRWSYPCPYPGVHGSHRAPMPSPGLLIGPLKICGVAKVNDKVGRVFVMRGNMGQDFLMTTDGLYIGALFKDGRERSAGLPPNEDELRGKSLQDFTHGGEPFNGWFGRQADGKLRQVCAFGARQAGLIIEMKGLDSIRRHRGPDLTVDAGDLLQAETANASRRAKRAATKRYVVKKRAGDIRIDGRTADWRGRPAMTIRPPRTPRRGAVYLSYDDERLYVLFAVSDSRAFANEGKDHTRLFKTGAAADLQFHTQPGKRQGRKPSKHDVRLVFSLLNDKPVVVLMRPVDPNAPKDAKVHYHSPVLDQYFDRVQVLADAQAALRKDAENYWFEASVPLAAIGLQPKPGLTLRGDAGFISADAPGRTNTARTYWANRATNIVSDLPHEARLYPTQWGEWRFE